ncbi:sugar phosphate isomerase/epimerase family protein [Paenibacillus sp. GD4]|uniref:sugar phosphate isomerase/epimerase family protein n=1 Tax=Paenibacillus sp. GD4 TaxID=3068890 RepID=UPI0027969E61|nr:sugar phosphate isomerase/epimerase family protein [Paenibacillus sp. GD4]MDQ1914162.1 sugar phosphate isomerase/epimerase family protein [Paenibacillus sp. GD4]
MSDSGALLCSLCTISFRHALISFDQILQYADRHGFDGVELWGVHARQLYEQRQQERLSLGRLHVSMISDYLDIGSDADMAATITRCCELLKVAEWADAKHIRTFAGRKPSKLVNTKELECIVGQLRILGDLCLAQGVTLLVETHPGTLADDTQFSLQLMQMVDHEAVGLNLDFLHLWEAGDQPVESYRQLEPWVGHFHFKNVATRSYCHVFEPQEVYSPSGKREGMAALGDGAVNYREILRHVGQSGKFASLEWFGASPFTRLSTDLQWLRQQLNQATAEIG